MQQRGSSQHSAVTVPTTSVEYYQSQVLQYSSSWWYCTATRWPTASTTFSTFWLTQVHRCGYYSLFPTRSLYTFIAVITQEIKGVVTHRPWCKHSFTLSRAIVSWRTSGWMSDSGQKTIFCQDTSGGIPVRHIWSSQWEASVKKKGGVQTIHSQLCLLPAQSLEKMHGAVHGGRSFRAGG